jgi:hypothetical protein
MMVHNKIKIKNHNSLQNTQSNSLNTNILNNSTLSNTLTQNRSRRTKKVTVISQSNLTKMIILQILLKPMARNRNNLLK